MSTAQDTIGKLIAEGQQRDAIHIAMAPVVAGERLRPGQGIAFEANSTERVHAYGTTIGIVDPFLANYVEAGQRFWMFLYPNTITALRHDWTHPAFAAVEPAPQERDDKAASEAWLRAFVAGADCPSYERVIAAAVDPDDRQWDDEYLHFEGSDAHGEIPPEFWHHVEVVTGRKITRRPAYFSCSC